MVRLVRTAVTAAGTLSQIPVRVCAVPSISAPDTVTCTVPGVAVSLICMLSQGALPAIVALGGLRLITLSNERVTVVAVAGPAAANPATASAHIREGFICTIA